VCGGSIASDHRPDQLSFFFWHWFCPHCTHAEACILPVDACTPHRGKPHITPKPIQSVESIKTLALVSITISFGSEENMNKHSCKSCGKICLSNDFDDGYCLACSRASSRDEKPTRSHQRDEKIDAAEAALSLRKENEKKQQLIQVLTEKQRALAELRQERAALEESRANLERSTKENLTSILRLRVETEKLNTSEIVELQEMVPVHVVRDESDRERIKEIRIAETRLAQRQAEIRKQLAKQEASASSLKTKYAQIESASRRLSKWEEATRSREEDLEANARILASQEKKILATESRIRQERSQLEPRKNALAAEERRMGERLKEARWRIQQLKKREQALTKASNAHAATERKLGSLDKKLKTQQKALTKKETDLRKKEQQLSKLAKKLAAIEARWAKVPKTRIEFKKEMDKAASRLNRAKNQVVRLKKQIEDSGQLERIVEWTNRGIGPSYPWPYEESIVLVGEGPFPRDEIRVNVRNQQFHLRAAGNSNARIMVVGREQWDEQTIDKQIRARQGNELRIYSQEMFLLASTVFRDPFDECDEDELIDLFAADHPALQYLIERGFNWPCVGMEKLGDFVDPGPVEESPLHLMGYHVGRYSKLTTRERRHILKRAYEGPLKPVPDKAYMQQWGTPRTERRLWRMAHHIAFLANSQGRARNKKLAGTEWVQDLQWMKKTLLEPWMTFKWPKTKVPGAL
jgi:hypothetical protein